MVESRCRAIRVEIWRHLDPFVPVPYRKAPGSYAVHAHGHLVRIPRRGDRYGEPPQRLANRRVQGYRQSNVLLRVSVIGRQKRANSQRAHRA